MKVLKLFDGLFMKMFCSFIHSTIISILLLVLNMHSVLADHLSITDAISKVVPAVVTIECEYMDIEGINDMRIIKKFKHHFKDFRDFDDNIVPFQRIGSGFIIDASGYIVTNNHMIADMKSVKVKRYVRNEDGSDEKVVEHEAKLIGRDPGTDLALLKIDPGQVKLPYLTFDNSEKLRVGERVFAVGIQFGTLNGTATTGIVSAKNRYMPNLVESVIQTDASINPGSSGGPLCNKHGNVVGVNYAIFSHDPLVNSGIAFAIPSNVTVYVIEQLKKYGRVMRPYMGLYLQEINKNIAESLRFTTGDGLMVLLVTKDSPAEKAGLRPTDVIVEFNNKPVGDIGKFRKTVARYEVGKVANVKVWRNGKYVTISVVLLEDKEAITAAVRNVKSGNDNDVVLKNIKEKLGIEVVSINDETSKLYQISPQEKKGVIVSSVDYDKHNHNLYEGDRIIAVTQSLVEDIKSFYKLINEELKGGNKKIGMLIERDGKPMFVIINA